MNILEALEINKIEDFKLAILDNPSLINTINEEGWNILSICVYDNLEEHLKFLLPLLSKEQINESNYPDHPLYIALSEKNKNIAKLLLEHIDINVDIKLKNNESALFYAVELNDLELFNKLLNKNIDLTTNNFQDINIISYIIKKNEDKFLTAICENNKIEQLYSDHWLLDAIKNNNSNILKLFYSNYSGNYDTLLNNAIDFKSINVISFLLDSGDIIPGENQIRKIIDLACITPEKEDDKLAAANIIDFLFSIKVPFNKFTNEKGENAWMLSIKNSNDLVFNKLLTESNEQVNTEDNRKETALFYAIESNNIDYVKSLLHKKANPNHKNIIGDTPLIKAIRYNNEEAVEELLKYPILINELNSKNENALSIAIHLKKFNIVSKLIWAGGDITSNPTEYINSTDVYHINSEGNYEKLFSDQQEYQIKDFIALAQLGLNLNQINENGDSFIQHFIKEGYMANYKALLNCSLDFNLIDTNGNSPLMNTIVKKNTDYFFMLLKRNHNLNLDIINKDGLSAYDIAFKTNNLDIINRLIDYDKNINLNNANKVVNYFNENNLDNNYLEHIFTLHPNINKNQTTNKLNNI